MKKKILTFILALCLIIPATFMFTACSTTEDDNVQIRVQDGYVQWSSDDSDWKNVITIDEILDAIGDDITGPQGVDGKQVEFNVSATHIQWRYVGDSVWTNLIELDDLQANDGTDGKEVEFRKTTTHIQWRYKNLGQGDEENWTNLVALSELKGEKTEITIGQDGYWYIDGEKTDYKASSEESMETINISFDYNIPDNISATSEFNLIGTEKYPTSAEIDKNGCVTLPTFTDELNLVFDGWYTGNTNNDIKVSNYTSLAKDVTLVARWNIDKIENNIISSEYFEFTNIGTHKFAIKDLDAVWSMTSLYIPELYISNNAILGTVTKINKINAKLEHIEMPDTITELGTSAFSSNINLKSIKLSNSLTEIPNSTFNLSSYLESIYIPDNITKIGNNAFYGCSRLKQIYVSKNLTNIGEYAFYQVGLSSINLPNNEISIGEGAFQESSLYRITLPDNITALSEKMFKGCSSLKYFDCSEMVTEYPADIFNGCAFNNFTIGKNVQTIDIYAFENCASLNNYYVAEGNTHFVADTGVLYNIDKTILVKAPAYRTNISLPTSVITIGERAFTSSIISNVSLNEGLISINDNAFYKCANLTSIVLPQSLENIGVRAFADTGLITITIPSKVNRLSQYYNTTELTNLAFNGCPLEIVIINSSEVIAGISNNISQGYILFNNPTLYITEGASVDSTWFTKTYEKVTSDKTGYDKYTLIVTEE